MKLQNLKIGDKITHYCSGLLVEGTVVIKGKKLVVTKHKPDNMGERYIYQYFNNGKQRTTKEMGRER